MPKLLVSDTSVLIERTGSHQRGGGGYHSSTWPAAPGFFLKAAGDARYTFATNGRSCSATNFRIFDDVATNA